VEYHRIVAAYDFIKKASLKHQNETQEAIEVPHEMVELGTTD
jgi:hypothetical protein